MWGWQSLWQAKPKNYRPLLPLQSNGTSPKGKNRPGFTQAAFHVLNMSQRSRIRSTSLLLSNQPLEFEFFGGLTAFNTYFSTHCSTLQCPTEVFSELDECEQICPQLSAGLDLYAGCQLVLFGTQLTRCHHVPYVSTETHKILLHRLQDLRFTQQQQYIIRKQFEMKAIHHGYGLLQ